jgi:hypothetical protein
VISGLRPGDDIDLTSVGFDITGSITLTSGNMLQVIENGQTYDLHLDPSQGLAGWEPRLWSDGATGTDPEHSLAGLKYCTAAESCRVEKVLSFCEKAGRGIVA